MDWFTVNQIDTKTYVIRELNHWEELNSYLLIGDEKALLIDSGLGIGDIRSVIRKITNLPIVVVSTHIHWDHIGGHKSFEEIYVHADEEMWLNNGIPIPLSVVKHNVLKELNLDNVPVDFNIDEYQVFKGTASRVLNDSDEINIGERKLKVIHTPGHSPGHMCFFEKETGYIFVGDLIYYGTLYAFYESTDPKLYKNSIEKINKINTIKRVFSAHHEYDIPLEMIEEAKAAFKTIEDNKKLSHGAGTFEFNNFNIML